MPAECYLCQLGFKTIAKPIVNSTTPLGCCKSCHVFACANHAQRDSYKVEYICTICDVSLLKHSALDYDDEDGEENHSAAQLNNGGIGGNVFGPTGNPYFTSLDDFIRRRPGYGSELLNSIKTFPLPDKEKQFNFYFEKVQDVNAKRLLIAAGVIIQFLYDGQYPEELPADLRFLATLVSNDNNQTGLPL